MKITGTKLSVDDVLAALSNAQRRELLLSLTADPVLDGEALGDLDAGSATAIHHVHLPKLADYGLVDWDRDTGSVTRDRNFAAAEELLEFLARTTTRSPGSGETMSETAGDEGEAREEYGITDEDIEQIAEYLQKPRYGRTVDDLRSSE